jgi:hypothetical protein
MFSFTLGLRWPIVPLVVGLALPAMASQHEPFIVGELTPQEGDVLVLNAEESAELFDAVVEINSLGDDAFELVIESPPSFLDPLAAGWRLVAATDSPLSPLGSAEAQLVETGLLARLTAIETDDDHLLRLSLKAAELEEMVKEGTLTIIVVERVTSEYEDFPLARLQGDATPATGRWLPATFEERGWEPCPAEETAFEHEETLHFTPQASARIRFQATLAMKRQLSFEGGRLVEAQLEGRLCQGTEITPRFEEQITMEKTIWSRRRGPFYRMVGLVPIVFSVNARLDAMLGTSAQFTPRDPIRLHHDSAGGLRLQDGDWQPLPRPSHHQGPTLPSLAVDASIDASLALKPRLELLLYASGGPYLTADATTSASWQPGQRPRSDLSLTLLGGLTYRKGLWGDDWEHRALEPALYRWPEPKE